MILNRRDFFECPDCGLQVNLVSRLHAIIMEHRGTGDLKRNSPDTVDTIENCRGRILSELDHNGEWRFYFPFRPGEMILDEEHLRQYISIIK